MRRWARRTDAGLAGYLLWGGWFVVTAIVFSYMSGIIHSYYAVALAPAIAALVGAGLVDLWSARARIWLGGIAVGLLCLGSAWFGSTLLDRTPSFDPGLGTVAILLAAVALLVLVVASLPSLAENAAVRRLAVGAAALGVCATLIAPAAYALDTTGTAYGGGDPHPGPGTTSGVAGGFGGGFGGPGGGRTGPRRSGTGTARRPVCPATAAAWAATPPTRPCSTTWSRTGAPRRGSWRSTPPRTRARSSSPRAFP